MAVYFLKHPSSDFTGIMGGVDFYDGRGSTSSLRDARGLSEKGCIIYDEQRRSVVIEAHINPESRAEVLEAKAETLKVELQDKGGEAPPPASSPKEVQPDVESKKPKRGRPRK